MNNKSRWTIKMVSYIMEYLHTYDALFTNLNSILHKINDRIIYNEIYYSLLIISRIEPNNLDIFLNPILLIPASIILSIINKSFLNEFSNIYCNAMYCIIHKYYFLMILHHHNWLHDIESLTSFGRYAYFNCLR